MTLIDLTPIAGDLPWAAIWISIAWVMSTAIKYGSQSS